MSRASPQLLREPALSSDQGLSTPSSNPWLTAIVLSSDDAIISKSLDGIITSWNRAAERLFGYTAAEVIGQPISMLMPPERKNEMALILERIRRGERVDHFDTVRQRKDGTLIQVSLTVSPVHDAEGRLIGASKIARDVTERKRMEEQQKLLVAELNHRVKNTLATVQSIAKQTLTGKRTLEEARDLFLDRVHALAYSHEMLATSRWRGADLQALVEAAFQPYGMRVALTGDALTLNPQATQILALALNELATNAAKHGALSRPEGRVEVAWSAAGGLFRFVWRERGGPPVAVPTRHGFGRTLVESAVAHELCGTTRLDFLPEGVTYTIEAPLAEVAA